MRRCEGVISIVMWVVVLAGSVLAQSIQITAFDQNGSLTWTNGSTNAVCTVQWASALTTNTQWSQTWANLLDIMATNATTTVNVPMFYRVRCWTNGLLVRPMSPGAVRTYAASNSLGETWMSQDKFLGYATLPLTSNEYSVLYSTGAYENFYIFVRSTDHQIYTLVDPQSEGLMFQLAPPGTTWSNAAEPSAVYSVASTNETVTVPAGTFTGCLKIRRLHTDVPGPDNNEWYWIKPGFWLIQQITEPGVGDLYYHLQSWSDQ
ncbi:MAG: hypothetical protein ABSA97_03330 [Verrucomicrobiia bacterium]